MVTGWRHPVSRWGDRGWGALRRAASGETRACLIAGLASHSRRRWSAAEARKLFLVEHLSFVDARAPEQDKHAAKTWVMASWAAVRPRGSGRVYPNFPIPAWTTSVTLLPRRQLRSLRQDQGELRPARRLPLPRRSSSNKARPGATSAAEPVSRCPR